MKLVNNSGCTLDAAFAMQQFYQNLTEVLLQKSFRRDADAGLGGGIVTEQTLPVQLQLGQQTEF